MANKFVLDTHTFVWYLEGNPRLGSDAKKIMDDPRSELVLPLIALSEADFIVERRRTSIPTTASLLSSIQEDPRIEVYPFDWAVFQRCLSLRAIPELHDRIIVATALHLQSLVSAASFAVLIKKRLGFFRDHYRVYPNSQPCLQKRI